MSIKEHKTVCEVLRTRIKRRKSEEERKRIIEEIREAQTVINSCYRKYPYCKQCKGRMPVKHICITESDDD